MKKQLHNQLPILFFTIILAQPISADPVFCEALKEVLRDSLNDFLSVRAAYDEEFKEWKPRIVLLPNAECYVGGDLEYPEYSCTLDQNTQDQAERTLAGIEKAMRACLPNWWRWRVGETQREGRRVNVTQELLFPEVTLYWVRSERGKNGPEYYVRLSVEK